ncbi:MAG: lipoyl synthase [Candidatus Omnitrophota bacterium]
MNAFPEWLKRPLPTEAIERMNELLKNHNLHTVCQSARCPNIGECFQNREATFMILGNTCTRNCGFCSVKTGMPQAPDSDEPQRIAHAVKDLGLKYVVITSVTRDDIDDAGAEYFVNTIEAVRVFNPGIKIEILTPDFKADKTLLNKIIQVRPDVFAHNIETVPRLYGKIRPQAKYEDSLFVLKFIKNNSDILTKSGIILGLGETRQEVLAAIKDLKCVDCDVLTIGQYLKPDHACVDVQEYITPEQFEFYKSFAECIGFKSILSGPFIRSSYKAREAYKEAMEVYESSVT